MKNYNLLSEEEKNLITNTQEFSRLIVKEYNREESISGGRLSEKGKQLKAYREEFLNKKKLLNIEMRAFSLNLAEQKKKEIFAKLVTPEMIGKNVLKVDSSFLKKYEDFFNLETEEGKKDGFGFKIWYHVGAKYNDRLQVNINISLWKDGVNGSERTNFDIYKLEDKTGVITDVCELYLNDKIKVSEEVKKAQKYLDYLKESEEKLSKLKSACNTYMLETIKNNQ